MDKIRWCSRDLGDGLVIDPPPFGSFLVSGVQTLQRAAQSRTGWYDCIYMHTTIRQRWKTLSLRSLEAYPATLKFSPNVFFLILFDRGKVSWSKTVLKWIYSVAENFGGKYSLRDAVWLVADWRLRVEVGFDTWPRDGRELPDCATLLVACFRPRPGAMAVTICRVWLCWDVNASTDNESVRIPLRGGAEQYCGCVRMPLELFYCWGPSTQ